MGWTVWMMTFEGVGILLANHAGPDSFFRLRSFFVLLFWSDFQLLSFFSVATSPGFYEVLVRVCHWCCLLLDLIWFILAQLVLSLPLSCLFVRVNIRSVGISYHGGGACIFMFFFFFLFVAIGFLGLQFILLSFLVFSRLSFFFFSVFFRHFLLSFVWFFFTVIVLVPSGVLLWLKFDSFLV